jgi:hypothetical protein
MFLAYKKAHMITLGLDQPGVVYPSVADDPKLSKLLRTSWRVVLLVGIVFADINEFVSKVVKDRPWLWSLSFVVSLFIVGLLDKLVLSLYMKYAPSIFDRETR